MEKIKVTSGVYWVGIPEASLYILCGCPADSVKHLMKKGLIATMERNGVKFETGPNAILVSDVPLQNQNFANLSEFPVLQMLYRQGLILPGHPNNTGIKPILIGKKDQVESQSKYIFLGNYGLTSKQEIMKAGVDEKTAEQIMRFKMRFAFNKILKTEELVETCIIQKDNEFIEIRNRVFVRRKGLNIYEFRYGDKSIDVNLNLPKDEETESPYDLGFHKISKEYFSVVHTGEGDGWDFSRPCVASILTYQGKVYLIDAGPNIQKSLTALGININEIEGIFHTHAHDDHFVGLTTLIRSDHRIKYYSTPLVRTSVVKKISALMFIDEEEFSKYFEVHDLVFDEWNNIDGLEIMPILSPHPIETNIFIFRTLWADGYNTYAHFADIVSMEVLRKMITDDPSDGGISKEFYDSVREKYLTPADLKKIDIGGGLIHGEASDFLNDESERIILSHTSRALSISEKEVGSTTSFASQDIMVRSSQDYSLRNAFRSLEVYFPETPAHELSMLLNCPILSFDVGSILLKKGRVNENVYIILNGVVEYLESGRGIRYMVSVNSIIGDLSCFSKKPSIGTFRALSYVRALQIPNVLLVEFVKRNNLYEKIKQIHDYRQFLQNTWLFGEMVSYNAQSSIANIMKKATLPAKKNITKETSSALLVLNEGEIELLKKDRVIETLSVGDFFGEEKFLFGKSNSYSARSTKQSEIFYVPNDALKDIPIIRWKLRRTFEKRVRI